jgi:hypothetical protein
MVDGDQMADWPREAHRYHEKWNLLEAENAKLRATLQWIAEHAERGPRDIIETRAREALKD